MKKLRVLLADDHQIVRDGLRLLIETQRDMRVVGEAGSGKEAVRQALELKPDVVIMDLSMPEFNGLQATKLIRAERPDLKIVALTVHEDPSNCARPARSATCSNARPGTT
jgi:two-component system response regulator NreC